jgi:hypothetical protein
VHEAQRISKPAPRLWRGMIPFKRAGYYKTDAYGIGSKTLSASSAPTSGAEKPVNAFGR